MTMLMICTFTLLNMNYNVSSVYMVAGNGSCLYNFSPGHHRRSLLLSHHESLHNESSGQGKSLKIDVDRNEKYKFPLGIHTDICERPNRVQVRLLLDEFLSNFENHSL